MQIFSDNYQGYERIDTHQQLLSNYTVPAGQIQEQAFGYTGAVGGAQNQGINLTSINTSNLSQEEQTKLLNITNIQNMINNTSNPTVPNIDLNKDNRGEKNFKRELTDREKAKLELEKWNREQKKVDY